MNNSNFSVRLLSVVFSVFSISCNQEEELSTKEGIDYIDSTRISISEVLDLGKKPSSLQGLSVFDSKAYQFYGSGICRVFNLETRGLVSTLSLPEGHYGSVDFSYEYENPMDKLPLLYVGGRMDEKDNPGYVIVNLNTQSTSRIIEFDQPVASQVLCAFDFHRGIGYISAIRMMIQTMRLRLLK